MSADAAIRRQLDEDHELALAIERSERDEEVISTARCLRDYTQPLVHSHSPASCRSGHAYLFLHRPLGKPTSLALCLSI